MSAPNLVFAILLVILIIHLSACSCPPGYANDGYVCVPPVSVPFR